MDKDKKKEIIAKFAKTAGDTGSSEVQIAVLTQKIKEMTEHLKTHKKDNSSRRGLLSMVNLRRKHLNYLSKTNHDKYLTLTEELGIRRK